MPDATFKIEARSTSPVQVIVQAGKHELIIDEPPALGGEGKGPDPIAYMLSALMGCINITGHVVAKDMGIEIRGLQMTATGALNPDKFRGRQTDDRAGLKHIEVTLRVDSDAGGATLAKWVAAVEARCPVSDNLSAPTPVSVKIEP
jgi:uncharacterized OsmC-like protein